MPSYLYTARDSSGNASSGTIAANSVSEVTQVLRRDGKYPTSIEIAPTDPMALLANTRKGIKIPRADVIQLSTQLAIMVETGVTLSEALDSIAKQSEKPRMQQVMADLCEQLQAGNSFSDALARHPRSF